MAEHNQTDIGTEMNKYIIKELPNLRAKGDGVEVEARNLIAARFAACKKQASKDSVMVILSQDGKRLAYKEKGRWFHR